MPDAALSALIPVAGVIAAALIAGLFMLASKRSDAQAQAAADTDEARRELVALLREQIAVKDAQIAALEAKVANHEHRQTRRP